jgi:hypothetical protein
MDKKDVIVKAISSETGLLLKTCQILKSPKNILNNSYANDCIIGNF